jgi:hypothetical protein
LKPKDPDQQSIPLSLPTDSPFEPPISVVEHVGDMFNTGNYDSSPKQAPRIPVDYDPLVSHHPTVDTRFSFNATTLMNQPLIEDLGSVSQAEDDLDDALL